MNTVFDVIRKVAVRGSQWDPTSPRLRGAGAPALVARGDQLYLNEDHASGSTGSPQVGGAALMSWTVGGKDEQFLMTDYLGTTLGALVGSTGSPQAGTGNHASVTEGTEIGRANLVRTSFGDGAAAPSGSERFTGKPYDADLGAHVFPYRNYRADLGRWMSADPINFPDGPNQHHYAPVPTMGVDPWGLESGMSGNYAPNRTGVAPSLLDYVTSPAAAITSLVASNIIQATWESQIKITASFDKNTGEWGDPTPTRPGDVMKTMTASVGLEVAGTSGQGSYGLSVELNIASVSVKSTTAASEGSPATITYEVDLILTTTDTVSAGFLGSGGTKIEVKNIDVNDVTVTIHEN